MGNLLNLLYKDEFCCPAGSEQRDIFVDFENAQPSEAERELYEESANLMFFAEEVLEKIRSYQCESKSS